MDHPISRTIPRRPVRAAAPTRAANRWQACGPDASTADGGLGRGWRSPQPGRGRWRGRGRETQGQPPEDHGSDRPPAGCGRSTALAGVAELASRLGTDWGDATFSRGTELPAGPRHVVVSACPNSRPHRRFRGHTAFGAVGRDITEGPRSGLPGQVDTSVSQML